MKGNKGKKIEKSVTIDYENKKLSVFYFLPLLLIAGFVPLIVYAKYIDLTGTTQALYWTGQQQYLDFFSYWKSRWVIVLTVITLLFYIELYFRKKLPLKDLKQYYIPLGIYAIFVIISTIFAKDVPTALWGFVDMYQGMFVLLSYVAITFLTINFVNNERDVNLFVKAFTFLMIVEGVIGVGQYFGFDFFQTGLGNKLILPNNLMVEDLSFSFGPKTIYGTLFNTNFVGSFATLMLPLSVAFLLGSKTNKQRIISAIAIILMLFVWIGCNSRAGYIGVAVSALFGFWLFRKVIIKHWKETASLFTVFIILLIGLNVTSGGVLFYRLKSLNIITFIQNIKLTDNKYVKIEDIILKDNVITIKTDQEILCLEIEEDKVFFKDENNNEMRITTDNDVISINDERYTKYKIIMPKNYPGITVRIDEPWKVRDINFYITDEGIKVLASGGRISTPIIATSLGLLDGLESIASGRGYIWGRTIPLLEEYLISGSGADNYPIAFPQDDFVAKVAIGMDANMVVDKPHNMYLQIGVNTGVISLIALISVFIIYILSSLKLYGKIIFNSLEKFLGASCFVSIIGYLVAAVFNDYIVSVAPLFWIILGLGISINIRISSKTS